MATHTGIRSIDVITVMTLNTIIGDQCMRPIERIKIIVHRKSRGHPVRFRSVTHGTIGRKVEFLVVGVGSSTEIHGVTIHTIR